MSKFKKILIIFGIVFFATLSLLTYFSSTIEYLLLPKISVTTIESGTLTEDKTADEGVYLVSVNAVIDNGEDASFFAFFSEDDSNIGYVQETRGKILNRNDLYYELKLTDPTVSSYPVVYEASKDLSNGAKVALEAEDEG